MWSRFRSAIDRWLDSIAVNRACTGECDTMEKKHTIQRAQIDAEADYLYVPYNGPVKDKNAIRVIYPYLLKGGTWVFDDEEVNLKQEPFVLGTGEIITAMLMKFGVKHAGLGFTCLFSDQPFPGAEIHMVRGEKEYGGYWYTETTTKMEGWLCPATLRYFREHPRHLYIRLEEYNGKLPQVQ